MRRDAALRQLDHHSVVAVMFGGDAIKIVDLDGF